MDNQSASMNGNHGVSVYYDSGGTAIAQGEIAREMRRSDVVQYLKQGKSHRQIAELLHVSLQTVYNDAAAVFAEWRESRAAMVDQEKELDLQRLADIMDARMPAALRGDRHAVKDVLNVVRIRRDTLGYAAPKKIDITAFIVDWATREGMDPNEVLDVAYEVIPQLEKLPGTR